MKSCLENVSPLKYNLTSLHIFNSIPFTPLSRPIIPDAANLFSRTTTKSSTSQLLEYTLNTGNANAGR